MSFFHVISPPVSSRSTRQPATNSYNTYRYIKYNIFHRRDAVTAHSLVGNTQHNIKILPRCGHCDRSRHTFAFLYYLYLYECISLLMPTIYLSLVTTSVTLRYRPSPIRNSSNYTRLDTIKVPKFRKALSVI